MSERIFPKVVLHRNVRNQSRRAPVRLRGIVLHSTEGANRSGISDLVGLANQFDNPVAQASSHIGVDQEGQSSRMVPDAMKAWTCVAYNSATLNLEAIGFSSEHWDADFKRAQRREIARWVAAWSKAHGIPLRRGIASGGVIIKSGVFEHRNLGVSGGGHHDISPSFPMTNVLRRAAFYRARMR